MKKILWLILPLIFITTFSLDLAASDTSDAEMLRARCEKENKVLEVSVLNFGDTSDQAKFQDGQKRLKIAKLKITQSRFKEAVDIYNEYLKLQGDIYTSLAKKYIDYTQKLNDEISEEMVDSIDNPKVNDYFKLAYRNLEDAKTSLTRNYPVQVIDACRRSKEFSLGVYTILKKAVPEKYKVDIADNKGTIGK